MNPPATEIIERWKTQIQKQTEIGEIQETDIIIGEEVGLNNITSNKRKEKQQEFYYLFFKKDHKTGNCHRNNTKETANKLRR